MAFLTDDDYDALIDLDDLNVIMSGDENIRVRAEEAAQEHIIGFCRSRYDMEYEFSLTGDDRNKKLVQVMLDIVIYDLYTSTRQGSFPEKRRYRKEDADDWLDRVQTGKVMPGFKILDDEDGISDPGVPMRFGGNDKNTSEW